MLGMNMQPPLRRRPCPLAFAALIGALLWTPACAHEEPELTSEERIQKHHITAIFCLMIIAFSLGVKALQHWKVKKKREASIITQIVLEMVEAGFEEFTAAGVIGCFLIILRMNPFMDVLHLIAAIMHCENELMITEIVEQIHSFIFVLVLYYFSILTIIVGFIEVVVKKSWEADELKAASQQAVSRDEKSQYLRLRSAFLNPFQKKGGVYAITNSALDKANFNFRTYMTSTLAKNVQRVIVIPTQIIILSVLVSGSCYLLWSKMTHHEEHSNSKSGLMIAAGCSWFFFTIALWLFVTTRSIFYQILPPRIDAPPPYMRFPAATKVPSSSERRPLVQAEGQASGAYPTSVEIVDEPKQGWLSCTSGTGSNLHQRLFPFGKSDLLFSAIQILIFGLSVLAAAYEKTLSPELKQLYPILFAVYVLPLLPIMVTIPWSIYYLTASTSLEMMVDSDIAEVVIVKTRGSRLVPFAKTIWGKKLVHQMRYESIWQDYEDMSYAERKAFIEGPEMERKLAELSDNDHLFLDRTFKKHDANGSKHIDTSELAECFAEVGFAPSAAREIAVKWIDIFDIDKAHREGPMLSLPEYKALYVALIRDMERVDINLAKCKRMCDRLDVNHNGRFSHQEFAQAFKAWIDVDLHAEDVAAVFRDLDASATCPKELPVDRIAEWIFQINDMVVVGDQKEAALARMGFSRNDLSLA